jgi:predicted nucleic-acid-binding protein
MMIGLDTNVIIRHLTQDDPVQSPKATALIELGLTSEEPGFVSVVVMVETGRVLERSYRLTGQEVAVALEGLLRMEALVIENAQEAFAAVVMLKEGRGSFADALIGTPPRSTRARSDCLGSLRDDGRQAWQPSPSPIGRWRLNPDS